jgi:hypothetical protein
LEIPGSIAAAAHPQGWLTDIDLAGFQLAFGELSPVDPDIQPRNSHRLGQGTIDLLAQPDIVEHDLAGEWLDSHAPRVEDCVRKETDRLFPDELRGGFTICHVPIREPQPTS